MENWLGEFRQVDLCWHRLVHIIGLPILIFSFVSFFLWFLDYKKDGCTAFDLKYFKAQSKRVHAEYSRMISLLGELKRQRLNWHTRATWSVFICQKFISVILISEIDVILLYCSLICTWFYPWCNDESNLTSHMIKMQEWTWMGIQGWVLVDFQGLFWFVWVIL